MEPQVDITRLSQRGQIVIPKDVRDRLGLKVGNKLIVVSVDDIVILQKAEAVGDRGKLTLLLERAREITRRLTRSI
jgi:AbrB family looped-hinge helix DNA binding protein